jgi:hypothetical protein
MNVNDHGHVRGNGHDYANGICNGNCHNNGSGTGQRIGNVNGNDNGKRKCNGKGYGDVTSRSRRGNDVSLFVTSRHVCMTVTLFSL